MDPPPTGLLAASTAPLPRPSSIPMTFPSALHLGMYDLCTHPIMSEAVPPDEYFETISARNIYIQTRRSIHEFNILQRRIARGVSLLQFVVPSADSSPTRGQYRVNPNGFLRALGTPEDNCNLGTTADEALLSRRQPHRNFDSSTPPESPPTPATPATPPPHYTDTYTLSFPHTSPCQHPSTAPGLIYTSSRCSTTSTLTSALDRSHQRSLDGRGLLHGHLWQATRFRTSGPGPTPLNSTDVPSPTLPEPPS